MAKNEEKTILEIRSVVTQLQDGTFYVRSDGQIGGKAVRFSGSSTTLMDAGTKQAEWASECAGRVMGLNLDETKAVPEA